MSGISYPAARPRIQTGDMIAIRSTHGGFVALTRWVTRSPYTHTAVAVWGRFAGIERLLIAETNGAGCSLSPLSHYEDSDFDVFDCPVDRAEAEYSLWELLGVRIAYDLADLGRIAANRLFGVPLPPKDEDGLICSAMSGTIYLHAGWEPRGLPSIPAPDDMVRAMAAPPKLEVRRG